MISFLRLFVQLYVSMDLWIYVSRVVRQLCDYLDIYCFKITPPQPQQQQKKNMSASSKCSLVIRVLHVRQHPVRTRTLYYICSVWSLVIQCVIELRQSVSSSVVCIRLQELIE